jgi:hypothetical protein
MDATSEHEFAGAALSDSIFTGDCHVVGVTIDGISIAEWI